jgi:hypothetical protein
MCQIVVVNKGEVEIETIQEFEDYFKTTLEDEDLFKDCCLCQIDVAKELNKLGIKHEYDCGDYYIEVKLTNTPQQVTTNKE